MAAIAAENNIGNSFDSTNLETAVTDRTRNVGVSKFKRHLDKVLSSQTAMKGKETEEINDHDSTHGSLIETDDEDDVGMDEHVDQVGLNPTSLKNL